jgi:threonine dehydrogenase-like Zn-dependent dehydrogenase
VRALVFRNSTPRLAISKLAGTLHPRGYVGPWSSLRLEHVAEPEFRAPDWAIVRTSLAGICGSDAKQAFLRGDRDNALTALISFPHVLGHEGVGVVERIGPTVTAVRQGQSVVLNPWLSCAPRGLALCGSCGQGDYALCENFARGGLPPGIHLGNCSAAGGVFAERFAAHESQLFPVPDDVSDEQAVLADPCSVQLHAVLRHPPPADGVALVYGCGTLGLMTIALLRTLHADTPVWAVARYAHQARIARELGAAQVLPSEPHKLIERIAALCGAQESQPWRGLPFLMDGAGVVYDTIGSPGSIEAAIRVARPRATIVVSGVEAPRRFEWTPLYFKELRVAGSNAFGVETFEGRRLHAFEAYFEMVRRGVDLSRLITHRVPLARYRDAFMLLADHRKSAAVKVVFDFATGD